jgi:hypothetical protein
MKTLIKILAVVSTISAIIFLTKMVHKKKISIIDLIRCSKEHC